MGIANSLQKGLDRITSLAGKQIIIRYYSGAVDSVYDDDFFSENHTDWSGDAPITMSRDTTDVQEGTYRIIATYDASANASFWFDNQTGKNMQLDLSNYSSSSHTCWGNASF